MHVQDSFCVSPSALCVVLIAFCASTMLLGLTGCRGLQVSEAQRVTDEDWVVEGDSPSHHNAIESELAPPLQEVWVYNSGAGFGAVSPLIVSDAVLVATRKGELHAIDLVRGKRIGFDSFGDALEGTPVIKEGLLFIPVGWGKRALFAYDLRRANVVWRKNGTAIEAGLLALEAGVLAANVKGVVRLYDARTGDVRWEHDLGDEVLVRATPVEVAGNAVVADSKGRVVAFRSADGVVEWTQTLGAPVYATLAAFGQTVLVPTTRGQFVALDAESGQVRWRFALPDTTVRFSAAAVDDDVVYVGATDGVLRALAIHDGSVEWTAEVDGALAATPLVTPSSVFVGGMDKKLYAFDRLTGALRWETELKGRVKSAMAARDGQLIVLTEPHHVYLFQTAEMPNHASTP